VAGRRLDGEADSLEPPDELAYFLSQVVATRQDPAGTASVS
jgi:hypothetical protein